jgi:hypothetical protein
MSSPITKQHNVTPTPAARPARRDWCCGTPITGPHTAGCAFEPKGPIDDDGPMQTEPPPAPTEVQAAASSVSAEPRQYGLRRAHEEFDLDLPSGSFVKLRRLDQNDVIRLNLIEVLDGFTPDLMANIRDAAQGEDGTSSDEVVRALSDPERSKKMFGPIDRVIAACVIEPAVSLDEPSTDDGKLVNVDDVDLVDKFAIFNAAFGEQLAALKSVRMQPEAGARDLSAGESVQPETE